VTIIQLERSEIIIDSLRTAYKDCLNTSLYYNAQNQNLQNQKSELEKLVKNITSQNNINSDGLGQCEFKLKRWKNVAKVSIGIAAIFGTVAVLR
jgi:hypothetical protein